MYTLFNHKSPCLNKALARFLLIHFPRQLSLTVFDDFLFSPVRNEGKYEDSGNKERSNGGARAEKLSKNHDRKSKSLTK